MKFPTPEQVSHIRKTKDMLRTNLKELVGIFGPYEKRMENWYVSGGCIASLLRGETVNDYDVYFKNKETMEHVVALVTTPPMLFNVADVDEKYREVLGKDGKCITENAVTMSNGLQFITRHYGEDIRDTFDFVHCMPMYDIYIDKLYISEEQYNCCVHKLLVVNEEKNVTAKRQQKFMDAGYYMQSAPKQPKEIEVVEDDDLDKLFGKKK